MTPHVSFDTIQLQNYLDPFRAGDRQATDALLRRVRSPEAERGSWRTAPAAVDEATMPGKRGGVFVLLN
jgi:hypothetical protein